MIDAATGWYVVPTTIKAVVLSTDGRVLLARNRRSEWELLGGWPTRDDETIADVIHREVMEEASVTVAVGALVHAELAVVGGHQVVIVAYRCECLKPIEAAPSDEHNALRWVHPRELPQLGLIEPYETAIRLATW